MAGYPIFSPTPDDHRYSVHAVYHYLREQGDMDWYCYERGKWNGQMCVCDKGWISGVDKYGGYVRFCQIWNGTGTPSPPWRCGISTEFRPPQTVCNYGVDTSEQYRRFLILAPQHELNPKTPGTCGLSSISTSTQKCVKYKGWYYLNDCGLHGQWSSSSNDCQCESGWINNITTEGTINFCAIRLLPDQEILTTTFAPDQRKGDGTDSPAARNSSMVVADQGGSSGSSAISVAVPLGVVIIILQTIILLQESLFRAGHGSEASEVDARPSQS
ncbi:hypothetical protein FOZ60_005954 [Perkinsus olseni]|uniref:Uncharacterized protein n=1 Tax=Perkinsus olseni TaxID=32597 RepID=A0A7J6NS57_PEROL|nr:hypothetical protein FOZ60_005954 [Perkinsus olseni]